MKLTPTIQKVYNLLNDQLTAHGNISITRTEIARVLNISTISAKRATDFITLNNMKPYGLKDIYSSYAGNLIIYSYKEIPDDIAEIDVHIIQHIQSSNSVSIFKEETELEDFNASVEYRIKE